MSNHDDNDGQNSGKNGISSHNDASSNNAKETSLGDNIIQLSTAAAARNDKKKLEAARARLKEKEARKKFTASYSPLMSGYKTDQHFASDKSVKEPLINLPTMTKNLLLAFLLIHLATNFAMDDVARYELYETLGFVAGHYTGLAPTNIMSQIFSPVTYMFLHGSWMHLAMNGFMMLAFGAGCEKLIGGRRLLALFLITGVISVIVQFFSDMTSLTPVIGASGGLSGLFAAVLYMMYSQGQLPASRFGIWPFIGIWIAISVIFGLFTTPGGSTIAWPAHIGGFLAGFLIYKPVMKYIRP
jgi:membrane associated rhomboid family serine protease